MNNRKCPACGFVDFATAIQCRRCGADLATGLASIALSEAESFDGNNARRPTLLRRAAITLVVALCAVLALHMSLLLTSEKITPEQRQTVMRAVRLLEERGFRDEAWRLRHLATFRQNDNWWNASVGHADAYAATNFPFEIVTLYPEFFTETADDTERAAILLHEAHHLRGAGEERAYTEVWYARERLGWTESVYGGSRIWQNTAQLTREHAPHLFTSQPGARAQSSY